MDPFIDDGVWLYGEDDSTPVAVASSGQNADQVGLVGQASTASASGWFFDA